MACDFAALGSIDPNDPEQASALLHECMGVAFSPQLWIWAIAITVVGALVGAWIGTRHNAVKRDAILGATLGPLGWIISWNLPERAAPRICPACSGIVQPGDVHCRHCGAKLNA